MGKDEHEGRGKQIENALLGSITTQPTYFLAKRRYLLFCRACPAKALATADRQNKKSVAVWCARISLVRLAGCKVPAMVIACSPFNGGPLRTGNQA
jgi:hypothetical protein